MVRADGVSPSILSYHTYHNSMNLAGQEMILWDLLSIWEIPGGTYSYLEYEFLGTIITYKWYNILSFWLFHHDGNAIN